MGVGDHRIGLGMGLVWGGPGSAARSCVRLAHGVRGTWPWSRMPVKGSGD